MVAVRKGTGAKAPAKNTPGPARGNRGKKSSSGDAGKKYSWPVLFWLAFIIFIIGLFLFNREAISVSIQNIRNEFAARKPSEGEKPVSTPPPTVLPVTPPEAKPSTPVTPPAPTENRSTPQNTPAQPSPPASQQAPASSPAPVQPVPRQTPAPQPVQGQQAGQKPEAARSTAELRERVLYFTQVDRDGSILRIKVNRKLPVSDSPMTDVIQALIAGPNTDEKNRNLLSLIPPNTQILSATVRGETAYISFSEEFQYNSYGVEGYAAQLRQVVYTVTEFSNIRYVQILIEGRRVDFLGEGIWIGSPLNREML